MYTDSITLYCVTYTCSDPFAIVITSKDPKMSKQGTAGKRKHITSVIPQKLEIIRRLESSTSHNMFRTSNYVGLSTVYHIMKQKDQLQLFVASGDRVKGVLKWQISKEPRLVQLDKVLWKLFTALYSK